MIAVQHLHKTFGDVVAVDDVTFSVEPGSIVGFLGPNGAGKSTTMRIIAGLLAPTAGRALVLGHDVADLAHDFRGRFGYLPESAPTYPEMSVRGFLRFVARLQRVPQSQRAADQVIERVGLGAMARRRIGTLSKGYRQRVGLGQALVHDPAVVVLDEPTSGLDPNQVLEIRRVIQELGVDKSVLFSSHLLPEVEAIADRVVVLNRGRVVADAALAALRCASGSVVDVHVGSLDEPAVSAHLAGVPGVTSIELLGAQADSLRLRVQAAQDVRAAIAAAVVSRWPLLGLKPAEDDLAEIFRALTVEPPPGVAPPTEEPQR